MPEITLTLDIDNVYDDGTIRTTEVVTAPAPDTEIDELGGLVVEDDWLQEFIHPATGTGREHGESGYFVKVIAASDPAFVGLEWEFGL